MEKQQFRADVRQSGDTAVVDLYGEIDAFAESGLNDAYQEASTLNPASVLLNFSEVDYINSTGIALIVGLLAEARKAHQNLLTCGLSDHYQEIFHITRLSDFMTLYPDEESALGHSA